ncbi:MAG: DNA translocase FtsK [Candidatus Tectimicrobiota bacterium]
MGLLVLLGACFLVLSVSSYSPDDPAWNYYVSHGSGLVQNRGGAFGATLADWSVQAFGSTVVCLAGIGGLGAWCLMQGRLKTALTVLWRGLLCFIAVSGALYLLFARDPMFGPALIAGGIGGKWLAELAVLYLSRPGAYIVLGSLSVAVLCVGVRLPWLVVLRRGLTRLGQESRAVGWRMSEGVKGVGRVVKEQGEVASRRIGRLTDWQRLDAMRQAASQQEPVVECVDTASEPDTLCTLPEPVMAVSVEAGVAAAGVAAAVGSEEKVVHPEESDQGKSAPPSQESVCVAEVPRQIEKHRPSGTLATGMSVSPPQRPSAGSRVAVVPDLPPVTSGMRLKARRPVLPAPALPTSVPEPAPVREPVREPATMPARSLPPLCPTEPPVVSPPVASYRLPPRPVPLQGEQPPSEARTVRSTLPVYALPSLEILDAPMATQRGQSPEELDAEARFLEQKLREFGVDGEVVQVLPGPVITMFEFAPAAGVKVNKIVSLQDDLALVMRALSVRVVAPIPGKAVVGIEVPHKRRETVRFRELLDSEEFRGSSSKLTLALGKDILGRPVVTDLALIPHLLIAGATGSGKSVGLNSLICSLLFRATPADVKMIMIDPKMLEFSVYDGVPHLLVPVVTDPKKAATVLRRVVEEMTRRYQLLAAKGVRSIAQYNQTLEEERRYDEPYTAPVEPWESGSSGKADGKLPYLVVVIDELSDLMMVSAREVEDSLMRLAQMARAAGIHLIVATQRPSVDVLTGVIKANFPARLSFQVTSKVDSRTILDMNGAETLLGRGDMLFLAPGTSKPQRVHGAYVSEAEIGRLVTAWKELAEPQYDNSFCAPVSQNADVEDSEYDEKYDEAVALVTKTGQASISMLQRRLRVGYNRAARMIEMMEREGVVGPADGIKPREVLLRNTYDDE